MKSKPSNYEELLKRAIGHLRLSSIAIVVNALGLSAVIYGKIEDTELFTWLFLLLVISIFRFLSSWYYKNHQENFSLEEWGYIFYFPLIISSVLWGYASFFFFLEGNVLYQAVLIIIVAGLSAGAISSLFSLNKAVNIFILFLLLPRILRLSMQEGFEYNIITGLVTLYLLLIYKIAGQIHEHYFDIINSREMYEEEREKLSRSEERFGKIFKQAPLGIVIYDNDLIIR
ncbi:MAG: hypothetical protein PHH41_10735, partial [Sulfurimonas sp.]|nr:hypothetical protein [Sulfurimonas sp.]